LAFAAPACLLSLSLYIESSSTAARGKMVEIRTFASVAVKFAGECSGDLCASKMRPAASLLHPDDLPIDDACSSDEPPPPIEKTADTPLFVHRDQMEELGQAMISLEDQHA
jgi:hypothetical protein